MTQILSSAFEKVKNYFRTFKVDRDHFAPLFLVLSAIGVTVSALLTQPPVWKILPLYVSLFIALLNSKVSRLAPLLGAFNSILYAIVYFSYGLYGMAAYALFCSSTLQFLTFFRWKRHAFQKSVVLQKMSWKMRILLLGACTVAFLVAERVLSYFGSSYLLLDNASALLGILITVIYMFAFIEYYYLQVVSFAVTFALYFTMIPDHPEQWAYFFQNLYAFICMIFGFFEARKLWKLQHSITQGEGYEHQNRA